MTVEQIVNQLNNLMRDEAEGFKKQLLRILKRYEKFIIANLLDIDPLKADVILYELLRKAGYFDLIKTFVETSYDKTYKDVKKLIEAGGLIAFFSKEDIEVLKKIKKLDLDDFIKIGADTVKQIQKDLISYSVSALSLEEMADNISQSLDSSLLSKYGLTYANTYLNRYSQAVIDISLKQTEEVVWVYRGHVPDNKIRPFCKCLMNQHCYYDKQTAQKIKDDSRRKYNCRHKVVPIHISLAKEEGFKECKEVVC